MGRDEKPAYSADNEHVPRPRTATPAGMDGEILPKQGYVRDKPHKIGYWRGRVHICVGGWAGKAQVDVLEYHSICAYIPFFELADTAVSPSVTHRAV